MTYVLIALPVVLVLAYFARRWFVARKTAATERDLSLPRELP